jgi:AhpD family alkylhydroperoxidase
MAVLEQTAPRIDWKTFQETVPEFATAMAAVTHALKKSGIEPEIRELIKIRASQINGCAFCIQYHLNDARKISVPAAKLDLLAAWRDAGIYSSRERAALGWTENVTLMAQRHISDEDFKRVRAEFSQSELAFLTVAISQINAWNRIAAPFQFTPPIPSSL